MIILLVIMALLGFLVAFAAVLKTINGPILLLIVGTITTGFMLGYLQGWAKWGQ